MKSIFEKFILKVFLRHQFTSKTLRNYFLKKYNIKVGMYTYGCFDKNRIASGTVIGRYCSFANTANIFNGNHGLEFLTLHAYAYNPSLGIVSTEKIVRTVCTVEDDVWLGHNSIILPSVGVIGRGAVIAAGAVVTKDVPRYAIVAGNPAKIIRMRFDELTIEKIEATRWWEWDKETLRQNILDNPDLVYHPKQYLLNVKEK